MDKCTHWLIFKFTLIVKRARFTPKQMSKMIIRDGMTEQEKEIFTEMLYNRKAILTWNFIKMRKVKRKIIFPQKIRRVNHKTWQVLEFQIPKD